MAHAIVAMAASCYCSGSILRRSSSAIVAQCGTSRTDFSVLQFDYLADQNESDVSRKSPGRYTTYQQRSNSRDSNDPAASSSDSACDSITQLHKQIESEAPMHTPLEKGDLDKLNEILKKNLSKRGVNQNLGFSYNVDPQTLSPGDYVVHKKVGIGQFVNIKEEVPQGKTTPLKYVYLRYADGMAKLPAKQAHRLLYRYFREGEVIKRVPGLSKLNDTVPWEKRKSEGILDAQTRVIKMIDAYIRRLKLRRPRYPKNVAGLSTFAAKFPYTPTPDQLKAFKDVEKDMTEKDTPMDRLVCGDVGFGKTEVAMRAIFHAASAKKQVLVLAPTTVLAKQHFEIISQRFSGFPQFKVALLSRFQNSLEKKQIVGELNAGLLHIIVGTHALLGRDIEYGNVGLLIIDEEQRFGVAQKEKISTLKNTVDLLTLSATPIPRTLHMALSGFRDASLISTPPPERLPITTHVSVYSTDLIRQAIKAELQRQGQVFYVVPRIQDIQDTEEILTSLFPELKVCIAHGKKSSNELEDTMHLFSEGEMDVLICTSIIESGLDISTVNTIIIENVQLLGLAQIYQLRGRVGRSDQAAHAYLLHPRADLLSIEAVERLKALEECCALGQGFQLAERDMAIRGIGSIFGEKQSGYANKLGIDLNSEILFEAFSRAQYRSLPQLQYEDVQLAMETSLSSTGWESVVDGAESSAAKGLKSLVRFTEELRSERGKEPDSLEVLLKSIYVKRMAADLGIHYIQSKAKELSMLTNMDEECFGILHAAMTCEQLKDLLSFEEGRLKLQTLVELPVELQLERLFLCLGDLRRGLPSFLIYQ